MKTRASKAPFPPEKDVIVPCFFFVVVLFVCFNVIEKYFLTSATKSILYFANDYFFLLGCICNSHVSLYHADDSSDSRSDAAGCF